MHSFRPLPARATALARSTGFILIPLAALLLAGCGTGTLAATSTSTAALTPTVSPTTAPTTVNSTALTGPCAAAIGVGTRLSNYVPTIYQIGDLIVTEARLGLAYPSQQLPDGTPLRPVQLPSRNLGAEFPDSPPVNPNLKESAAGYYFVVCNTAPAHVHVIHGVSVRIASFASYSGQLNAWQYCDGYFARPQGANYGGCGGAASYEEYLHATFSKDAVAGATAGAIQTGTGTDPHPGATRAMPLPVTLAPGASLSLDVGITPPTAPGRYAFTFGLVIDDQPPAFFSTPSAVLLAPVAHKWTGQACATPAMEAQIPQTVTNPPTMYICPES